MHYHHFQNFTIITFYTYYGIQIWGQRNVPHLCFRKALLVNSHQSGKVWQACTQQREKSHSHTNSAVSRQVFGLLGQHLYGEFFQLMVLYGPTSEEKVEKLVKIYRFYRAEEDNLYNLLKLFKLFFSFFQVHQIPLLFVFFIKKLYS